MDSAAKTTPLLDALILGYLGRAKFFSTAQQLLRESPRLNTAYESLADKAQLDDQLNGRTLEQIFERASAVPNGSSNQSTALPEGLATFANSLKRLSDDFGAMLASSSSLTPANYTRPPADPRRSRHVTTQTRPDSRVERASSPLNLPMRSENTTQTEPIPADKKVTATISTQTSRVRKMDRANSPLKSTIAVECSVQTDPIHVVTRNFGTSTMPPKPTGSSATQTRRVSKADRASSPVRSAVAVENSTQTESIRVETRHFGTSTTPPRPTGSSATQTILVSNANKAISPVKLGLSVENSAQTEPIWKGSRHFNTSTETSSMHAVGVETQPELISALTQLADGQTPPTGHETTLADAEVGFDDTEPHSTIPEITPASAEITVDGAITSSNANGNTSGIGDIGLVDAETHSPASETTSASAENTVDETRFGVDPAPNVRIVSPTNTHKQRKPREPLSLQQRLKNTLLGPTTVERLANVANEQLAHEAHEPPREGEMGGEELSDYQSELDRLMDSIPESVQHFLANFDLGDGVGGNGLDAADDDRPSPTGGIDGNSVEMTNRTVSRSVSWALHHVSPLKRASVFANRPTPATSSRSAATKSLLIITPKSSQDNRLITRIPITTPLVIADPRLVNPRLPQAPREVKSRRPGPGDSTEKRSEKANWCAKQREINAQLKRLVPEMAIVSPTKSHFANESREFCPFDSPLRDEAPPAEDVPSKTPAPPPPPAVKFSLPGSAAKRRTDFGSAKKAPESGVSERKRRRKGEDIEFAIVASPIDPIFFDSAGRSILHNSHHASSSRPMRVNATSKPSRDQHKRRERSESGDERRTTRRPKSPKTREVRRRNARDGRDSWDGRRK